MPAKVVVILSGCGFLDGSEIHESVLALLHLHRHGAEVLCVAPRAAQAGVVNHATGKAETNIERDVFVEAARIARGKITDIKDVVVQTVDAIVMPGGFGAAKNLSNFATRGASATVHTQVARLLREAHGQKKPIGAICIAPAVVAAVLGATAHPTLTIGNDKATSAALEAMGARHRECLVTECLVDADNRIVSTPAYMFDARVDEVSAGIGKLVDAVMAMVAENAR